MSDILDGSGSDEDSEASVLPSVAAEFEGLTGV